MTAQLLFVYNADSGVGHALLDVFHKLLSPSTYPCSLCGITYGPTSMRPDWKQFLQALPVPARFLYRDQLPAQYPQLAQVALPAVFREAADGQLHFLLTATELNALDLPGLMAVIKQRLAEAPAEA